MIPVRSGVHGGDWIACDVVSPGMGGRCIFSIFSYTSMTQQQLRGGHETSRDHIRPWSRDVLHFGRVVSRRLETL